MLLRSCLIYALISSDVCVFVVIIEVAASWRKTGAVECPVGIATAAEALVVCLLVTRGVNGAALATELTSS